MLMLFAALFCQKWVRHKAGTMLRHMHEDLCIDARDYDTVGGLTAEKCDTEAISQRWRFITVHLSDSNKAV